ncbi:MAG: hypothetical protein K0Q59_3532, partial [Paenibacillus sp.]|nr:hypothetical protein [Paenibacillus sp.]
MRIKRFTALIAIVLIVVVLAGAGWLVYARQADKQADGSPNPVETTTPSAADSPKPTAVTPEPVKPAPPPEPVIPVEKFDIVMFGTEMEGLYLARAATDEGLTVKILDPRDKVGGQLLQGEMLFLDETKDEAGRSLVQGRIKQLFDGFKSAKIRKKDEYVRYIDELRKDIPIESGITIAAVKSAPPPSGGTDATVTSVDYKTKDGQLKRVEASYWVDDTDFAALLSRLNATRMPGLEKFYGHPDKIE